jgi:hypothetical protein
MIQSACVHQQIILGQGIGALQAFAAAKAARRHPEATAI